MHIKCVYFKSIHVYILTLENMHTRTHSHSLSEQSFTTNLEHKTHTAENLETKVSKDLELVPYVHTIIPVRHDACGPNHQDLSH